MEDHQNTVRPVVSSAFARGTRNLPTQPPRAPFAKPVALCHAMPHGLKDSLRQSITPHFITDIASVLNTKRAMLAEHTNVHFHYLRSGIGSVAVEMH